MRTPFMSLMIALALTPLVQAKITESAQLPGWMAGHWCSTEAGAQGDEYWLPEAGGLMVGVSRSVAPGGNAQFEFLRIESIDGITTYFAQPQGREATAFKRVDGGENWIRFQNLAHDFPQQIEYRRDGESLHAKISGPGEDGAEFSIPIELHRQCSMSTAARKIQSPPQPPPPPESPLQPLAPQPLPPAVQPMPEAQ